MKKVVIGLLAILACHALAQSEDAALANLHKQAQQVGKATLDSDYETVVDMTHPKVVEFLGGKQKVVETSQKSMSALKAKGTTIKSVKISPAKEVHAKGEHLFGVAPMVTEISVGEKLVTEKSYLLGISSDKGKTWRFALGRAVANAKVKAVLPPLPDKLVLPKTMVE